MRTCLSVQATTSPPDRLHLAWSDLAPGGSGSDQPPEVWPRDRRRECLARPVAVPGPAVDRHGDQDPPVGRLRLLLPREPPGVESDVRDRLRMLEVLHEREVLVLLVRPALEHLIRLRPIVQRHP